MGSYPFSRQDIHNGGRIRRQTGDGQKVVSGVSLGIRLLNGMFRYYIVAAFWRVESDAMTHGDSTLGGPPLFPHAFRRIYAFSYTDRVDRLGTWVS